MDTQRERVFRLVAVGASLGGLRALRLVLEHLPRTFGLPIVVAQHQADDTGEEIAEALRPHSLLPLRIPEDKEDILGGYVYLAPAGYHLLVESDSSFALSTDPPVHHARPSIDVLFTSAAEAYGEATIGVALTGSTPDGASGLATIKGRGGMALVQDPATAESQVLPRAALASVRVDRILRPEEVGPFLRGVCTPLSVP